MTFSDPIGAGLRQGRIDQGVDYLGSGPLYALGSGTVVSTHNGGWPGLGAFIAIHLDDTSGESPYVYYAEDINPAVSVGQRVNAGQLIGTATGGSTGIEVGWANPPGTGQALAHALGGAGPTPQGQNFFDLVKSLGGIGGKGTGGAAAPASTTGFLPNIFDPASFGSALGQDIVVAPVKRFWNWILSSLGVKSLTDLLERGALIVFGAVLLIMGLVSITGNSNSSPLKDIQDSKKEAGSVSEKESADTVDDTTTETTKASNRLGIATAE